MLDDSERLRGFDIRQTDGHLDSRVAFTTEIPSSYYVILIIFSVVIVTEGIALNFEFQIAPMPICVQCTIFTFFLFSKF